MKQIQMIYYQKKNKNNYTITYKNKDENEVHRRLLKDLIAKKLHKCLYIRSIKEICNYDGTRTYKVYMDNGDKTVYTIRD